MLADLPARMAPAIPRGRAGSIFLVFLILHFAFPHFSRLTVRIEHFRMENRIPDAQLYHFPAGMVWNHEVESKHFKNVLKSVVFNSFIGLVVVVE